ncbi:hypothetical protein [Kitasatospora griseola]|uniref:hypothetical protein n=1 Tax=Kitasatospora griseola TaxID=2064 RepID=UPI0038277127
MTWTAGACDSAALIAYADPQSRTVHAWVSELGSGLPPSIEVVAQGNVTNGPRHPSAAGNPHQNLFVAYQGRHGPPGLRHREVDVREKRHPRLTGTVRAAPQPRGGASMRFVKEIGLRSGRGAGSTA